MDVRKWRQKPNQWRIHLTLPDKKPNRWYNTFMISLKSKLFFQIHSDHKDSIRKIMPILLVLAMGLIILSILPSPYAIQGYKDYLPLHTMLETVAIVIAMQVAGLGWSAYSHVNPECNIIPF